MDIHMIVEVLNCLFDVMAIMVQNPEFVRQIITFIHFLRNKK